MTIHADRTVDALYQTMRRTYGAGKVGANGYRSRRFFLQEQRFLLEQLNAEEGPILDIACGSGLMLLPIIAQGTKILGIDFNERACMDANANEFPVVRGDAFNLPFGNETISQIVNCGFLNQQPPERTRRFVEEAARILRPTGRLFILWRNADSLLHKSAYVVLCAMDKLTRNQPKFPQYANPLSKVEYYAQGVGLRLITGAVTLPLLQSRTVPADSLVAKTVGASLYAVFEKPNAP